MNFVFRSEDQTIQFTVADETAGDTRNQIVKIAESLARSEKDPIYAIERAMEFVKYLTSIETSDGIPFLQVKNSDQIGKLEDGQEIVSRPKHDKTTKVVIMRSDEDIPNHELEIRDEVDGVYHPSIQTLIDSHKEGLVETLVETHISSVIQNNEPDPNDLINHIDPELLEMDNED